eukprot:gb/GEZN01002959.1/.p1 GENE.gb/GEZN01002959.1/~~gb/GEZN01002959.1/.p1  ORF type:complete len:566 (+),score=80.81 gb/GEZN01002959.1/:27-1700(+)
MQKVSVAEWIANSDSNSCLKCNSMFTCLFRRHHCRYCGLLLCDKCTSDRMEGERICKACLAASQSARNRQQLLLQTPQLSNVKTLSPSVQGTVRSLTNSPLVTHWRKSSKSLYGNEKDAPPSTKKSSRSSQNGAAKGTIIVVDPLSTGAVLVNYALDRGYQVVRVWSADFPPNIKNMVLPGLRMEYVATVDHKGKLPDTIQALQDLKFPYLACMAGCEPAVELCDAIAEALNLPCNGTALSEERRDKYLMGEQVRRSGTRAVKQARASTWAECEIYLKQFASTFKIVLKPSASAGSDGVYLCTTVDEVRKRFDQVLGATNLLGSANAYIVLQEFLEGKEYVIDSVSRDGQHKCITVWEYDKRPANGTNFIYFGMRLMDGRKPHVKEMIAYSEEVLNALSILHGPSHMEVMMTPTGPCLVEVGSRPHGGEGSWVPLVTKCLGRNQVTATLDAYLDAKAFEALPPVPILDQFHGAEVMLVSRQEGILKGYPRLEEVKKCESFFSIDILTKPGDKIVKTIDCITRPGSIRLCHPDKYQVEADFMRIRDMEEEGFYDVAKA